MNDIHEATSLGRHVGVRIPEFYMNLTAAPEPFLFIIQTSLQGFVC